MEDHESYEKLMRPHVDPTSLFDQLRCPTINKAYIRERMRLPDQFLGACTLKEGTFVTILILQVRENAKRILENITLSKSVALAFTAYLCVYITLWEGHGNMVWRAKLKADFDPYMTKTENAKFIEEYSPKWKELGLALAITHGIYFVLGLGVCFGLCFNHCHPIVYVPWLLMTGFLLATTYVTGFLMFIGLFVILRPISVTWDVVPMILTFMYAIAWTYGFLIVIAHYQRRRIVQFWRKNKRKEFFGGQ